MATELIAVLETSSELEIVLGDMHNKETDFVVQLDAQFDQPTITNVLTQATRVANLSVVATTLEPDELATAELTEGEEGKVLTIGTPRGTPGQQGNDNLFIQQTAPVTTQPSYAWFETDANGNIKTLWVETGVI